MEVGNKELIIILESIKHFLMALLGLVTLYNDWVWAWVFHDNKTFQAKFTENKNSFMIFSLWIKKYTLITLR